MEQELLKNNPLNIQKYLNYREQFKRLEKALKLDFNLEAVFIEYAIMEDRTEAILRYEGNEIKSDKFVSISRKLNKIKSVSEEKKGLAIKYFDNNFIESVRAWTEERNQLIHALMEKNLTAESLREHAIKGKELCRLLCNKSNNYKRAVLRKKAKEETK